MADDKKPHGNRPYQVEARKRAFAGARLMITDGKSQEEAATAMDSDRTSIGQAMFIIQHGTVEEVSNAEAGNCALRGLYETIWKRTTPEERQAKRRPPAKTQVFMDSRQVGAEVWDVLKTGLHSFTSLPSPKETAAVVRKNAMRLEHTNRRILAALEWIQEFSDEITK